MNSLFSFFCGCKAIPLEHDWTFSVAGQSFGLMDYGQVVYLVVASHQFTMPGTFWQCAAAAVLVPVALIGIGASARQLG